MDHHTEKEKSLHEKKSGIMEGNPSANEMNVEEKSSHVESKPSSIQNDDDSRLLPVQNKRATSSTVFVTGISPSLSKLHIEKLFGKFGTVHRVDMKSSKSGATYYFCDMDSIEAAQKAIDNLNGRMLLHKRLVVQPANERTSSPHYSIIPPSHTNTARERKMLDRKIEDLKHKINQSKR
ncbi:RNA recognition motif containing protein [Nitzschia inconspicua]|uniref:RNA recognition motif containing protein n=1 Tax=Nitzschia inconspicua TaxID=303405 RepID=A0A9K3LKZ3_9STRA|nr:RNA recognition motif containing protein [Nitzschia inconspicua]